MFWYEMCTFWFVLAHRNDLALNVATFGTLKENVIFLTFFFFLFLKYVIVCTFSISVITFSILYKIHLFFIIKNDKFCIYWARNSKTSIFSIIGKNIKQFLLQKYWKYCKSCSFLYVLAYHFTLFYSKNVKLKGH